MKKQEVSILGAGGYTGKELLRLLKRHCHLQVVHITSARYAGQDLSAVFPELGISGLVFKGHDEALPERSSVFLAVPDKTSLEKVPELIKQGHKVVDLSGAFRLHDKETWQKSYNMQHTAFEQMKSISYGLPELFRDEISSSQAVANPGCYPTSVIFPLAFPRGLT